MRSMRPRERVVHRDLKPANIKGQGGRHRQGPRLRARESARPIGLGRSAHRSIASPTFMQTSANARVLIGTAAYMSPSRPRGRSADKRSDIWAFGCVLHEMLTDTPSLRGRPVRHARVRPDEGTGLERAAAATPASVRRLLRRCLAKDRNQRLADISDARLDLAEAVETAPPPPRRPERDVRAPCRGSSRRLRVCSRSVGRSRAQVLARTVVRSVADAS